jgi:hypothetical protein
MLFAKYHFGDETNVHCIVIHMFCSCSFEVANVKLLYLEIMLLI